MKENETEDVAIFKNVLDEMSSAIFRDFEELSKYYHANTSSQVENLKTANVHLANCRIAKSRYGDEMKDVLERAYRIKDYCVILSDTYSKLRAGKVKISEFVVYMRDKINEYECEDHTHNQELYDELVHPFVKKVPKDVL